MTRRTMQEKDTAVSEKTLQQLVEGFIATIESTTSYQQMLAGEVSSGQVAAYLVAMRYLISATPAHLRAAEETARRIGLNDVAEFCNQKFAEEVGHDQWATEDLGTLKQLTGSREPNDILPAMRKTVELLEQGCQAEPLFHPLYCYVVEDFTVTIGERWVGLVTQRSAIPRQALTVVTKHVELDVEHAEDGCRQLSNFFVRYPDNVPPAVSRVRTVLAQLGSFWEQLARVN